MLKSRPFERPGSRIFRYGLADPAISVALGLRPIPFAPQLSLRSSLLPGHSDRSALRCDEPNQFLKWLSKPKK